MKNKDQIKELIESFLRNEITLYDHARLDAWLDEDPELGEWMSECIESTDSSVDPEVRKRLNSYLYEINGKTMPDMQDQSSETGHRKKHRWLWLGSIVATIAVTFVAAALILSPATPPYSMPFAVSTRAGEHSRVVLPDGTEVILNNQTCISYHYDRKNRQRVLDLHGEALFDVETDPKHPFIVTCDGLEIECKGTRFNVKGYPEENNVTVVLSDGIITAAANNQTLTMKPGTKVCYDRQAHTFESATVDVADYESWTMGYDRFNDDRFEDILHTVSRRYGVEINIISPSLREVRISGSICDKTLDETLSILSMAAEAKYLKESDSTICFYKEP